MISLAFFYLHPPKSILGRVTVIAAYKLSHGCVMALDGRVTSEDTLISNDTPKHLVQGHCLVAFAGELGPSQLQAGVWTAENCKTLPELRSKRVVTPDSDWYCLVYDRSTGTLATLCCDGCVITHKSFAAIGSGELVAWGYLAASPKPRTAAKARILLLETIRATAQKITSCGGRCTFLSAQGKTRSVMFHHARC